MEEERSITLEQKMALQHYLHNPAITDSLLSESYTKEAGWRKNNVDVEISSMEELEEHIENILTLYTLLTNQLERETIHAQWYIQLRQEQLKEWIRNGEIVSFLFASTVPLEVQEDSVLIKLLVEQDVPYISLQDILGDAYADQVLLSPFCQIEERKVPKGSKQREIVVRKPLLKGFSTETLQEHRKKILQNFKAIKEIFDKIGIEPLSRQEILLYTNWKRTLITYIRARMKQVHEMV